MRAPKIVFIGAGSMSFGIPTYRDLFTTPSLAGATLSLVDIDPVNLTRMYELALLFNKASGLHMTIERTAERRDVLPGADFVISSLAIERCELWKHDFEVPKKHGIRHTLGENGGPGALFFTMRTIPVVMDIIRDMEALCPNAYFLNFSNPETRIVLAVSRYTGIRCMGLCHGIFMAQHDMEKIMGRPQGTLELFGAGMNHFQWIMAMRDPHTGEDLYPTFRKAEAAYDPSFMHYSRAMYHRFGLYPTCSDDHLGEYQAYGWEAGEEGYNFDWDAGERERMKADVAAVIAGKRDVQEWFHKSGEKAVEAVEALHFGTPVRLPSAIVLNDGAIGQLPPDVAVEVPVTVDAFGIHRHIMPKLPEGIIGLMTNQVAAQRLAVLAALKGSKEIALQALLCDPTINDTKAAVAIVDELFAINRAYIRPCL